VSDPVNDLHTRAMAALESWVGEPAGGLPEEFFLFISRFTPIINVDLWIQDERRGVLLTWREDDTYGAGWHIPGGIIRYKETAEARIRATAWAELGAEVEFDPEPIAIEQTMRPDHRERGHFISLLYRCRLAGPLDEERRYAQGPPRRDQWAWQEQCPPNLIPAQDCYRRFF
jgi:ADP-ribose pyrophosphatase YjhB (NUDIX family)